MCNVQDENMKYHVISPNPCAKYEEGLQLKRPHEFMPHYGDYSEMSLIFSRLCQSSTKFVNEADIIFVFPYLYTKTFQNMTLYNQEIQQIKTTFEDGSKKTIWENKKHCDDLRFGSLYRHMLQALTNSNISKRVIIFKKLELYDCEFYRDTKRMIFLDVDNEGPYNIPYVSNIRWNSEWTYTPPWKATHTRRYLLSFTGSLSGTSRAIAMRHKIYKVCKTSDVCKVITQKFMTHHDTIQKVLELKRKSTFCLEPPGFSNVRRSIIDSLLSGCIPILFMEQERFDRSYLPMHSAWKYDEDANAAHVLWNSDNIEDLMLHVQNMNTTTIAKMQRHISNTAHHLVYSFNAFPEDAIETLVKNISSREISSFTPDI